jgi:hypothetical protein
MMTVFIFSTPSHGNPFANLKSHKSSTYQKPFYTNNKVNSSISFEKESISCPKKDKPKILKIMEFPVSVWLSSVLKMSTWRSSMIQWAIAFSFTEFAILILSQSSKPPKLWKILSGFKLKITSRVFASLQATKTYSYGKTSINKKAKFMKSQSHQIALTWLTFNWAKRAKWCFIPMDKRSILTPCTILEIQRKRDRFDFDKIYFCM